MAELVDKRRGAGAAGLVPVTEAKDTLSRKERALDARGNPVDVDLTGGVRSGRGMGANSTSTVDPVAVTTPVATTAPTPKPKTAATTAPAPVGGVRSVTQNEDGTLVRSDDFSGAGAASVAGVVNNPNGIFSRSSAPGAAAAAAPQTGGARGGTPQLITIGEDPVGSRLRKPTDNRPLSMQLAEMKLKGDSAAAGATAAGRLQEALIKASTDQSVAGVNAGAKLSAAQLAAEQADIASQRSTNVGFVNASANALGARALADLRQQNTIQAARVNELTALLAATPDDTPENKAKRSTYSQEIQLLQSGRGDPTIQLLGSLGTQ